MYSELHSFGLDARFYYSYIGLGRQVLKIWGSISYLSLWKLNSVFLYIYIFVDKVSKSYLSKCALLNYIFMDSDMVQIDHGKCKPSSLMFILKHDVLKFNIVGTCV